MADSTLTVARTLEEWQHAGRGIRRVVHPFLESHPQHELALRQMDDKPGVPIFKDLISSREPDRLSETDSLRDIFLADVETQRGRSTQSSRRSRRSDSSWRTL